MKARRLWTGLFALLLLISVGWPAIMAAQTNNPTREDTTVNEMPRMQGMVDLMEAFGSHGSFAGPYVQSDEPVVYAGSHGADDVFSLSSNLAYLRYSLQEHIGFWIPPGDRILLVGAEGPINRRVPFSVGPDGVWVEISGVFYDPRSDDFAVRLQASYIGRGQHPRSVDDVNSPIPGGALYLEADWPLMGEMVKGAAFHVTASVFEAYGPNKHTNMYVAGQLFTQKIRSVTHIDAIKTMELDYPVNPHYVKWDALVEGEIVHDVIASGVCGLLAPALNPFFRVLNATGTEYEFDGGGHDFGHRYNPTGNDPSLWLQKTFGGRYFVVDSTTMSPSPNFVIDTAPPLTIRVTPLIYNAGRWDEMFYITEASVN